MPIESDPHPFSQKAYVHKWTTKMKLPKPVHKPWRCKPVLLSTGLSVLFKANNNLIEIPMKSHFRMQRKWHVMSEKGNC